MATITIRHALSRKPVENGPMQTFLRLAIVLFVGMLLGRTGSAQNLTSNGAIEVIEPPPQVGCNKGRSRCLAARRLSQFASQFGLAGQECVLELFVASTPAGDSPLAKSRPRSPRDLSDGQW